MATRRNGRKRTDRGPDGRFAEGNPGGPGRPRGYARLFREVVNEDALTEVLQAVLTRAREGDLRAAEVILRRAVPEVPSEEPNVLDSPEWHRVQAAIREAVRPFPEAAEAMDNALRRLEQEGAGPIDVEVPFGATPEDVARAVAAAMASRGY